MNMLHGCRETGGVAATISGLGLDVLNPFRGVGVQGVGFRDKTLVFAYRLRSLFQLLGGMSCSASCLR